MSMFKKLRFWFRWQLAMLDLKNFNANKFPDIFTGWAGGPIWSNPLSNPSDNPNKLIYHFFQDGVPICGEVPLLQEEGMESQKIPDEKHKKCLDILNICELV